MSLDRLHVAQILPWSDVSGVELSTLCVAKAAQSAGFRSTIFCADEATPVGALFKAAGFEVVGVGAIEPRLDQPFNFVCAASRLTSEIMRRGVHMIHGAEVQAIPIATVAGTLARVPVICHVRNRHPLIQRRNRAMLHAVSKFVFVSQATRDHFPYKVSDRRARVIYNNTGRDVNVGVGVGPEGGAPAADLRAELGIPAGAKVVLTVARVSPQKDFETLGRAARRVLDARPDVGFLFAGDHQTSASNREHFAHVLRTLQDLGVDGSFRFAGFRSDVGPIYDLSDVCALSTKFEGFPRTLLEAMAHAKPLVATAVDGIPELVVPGVTGLLHPPGDDAQLAADILRLLDDPAFAGRMVEAASGHLEANFSWRKYSSEIASLYREVSHLGDTRRPAAVAV